jgi:hypothetical protein
MDREYLPTDEDNHGPPSVNVVVRGSQWGQVRQQWEQQVLPLLIQHAQDTRADGKARGVLLVTPGKIQLQITVSRFHMNDVTGEPAEPLRKILTPVAMGDA